MRPAVPPPPRFRANSTADRAPGDGQTVGDLDEAILTSQNGSVYLRYADEADAPAGPGVLSSFLGKLFGGGASSSPSVPSSASSVATSRESPSAGTIGAWK